MKASYYLGYTDARDAGRPQSVWAAFVERQMQVLRLLVRHGGFVAQDDISNFLANFGNKTEGE
jgi:hypothetical protein